MSAPPARSRRWLAVLLLSAVVAVVAACGVPADDGPRAIAPDAMPVELRDPSAVTSTTLAGSETTQTQVIYLVRTSTGVDGTARTELVPLPIEVTGAAQGDELAATVIATLLPFKPEDVAGAPSGTSNKIPPDVQLRSARITADGVLELDLSSELSTGIQGEALRQAAAQIVFTGTGINGAPARSVRILVNGTPVAVPTEEGQAEAGRAVSRSDYADLGATLGPR